jgi:hypothetical protein
MMQCGAQCIFTCFDSAGGSLNFALRRVAKTSPRGHSATNWGAPRSVNSVDNCSVNNEIFIMGEMGYYVEVVNINVEMLIQLQSCIGQVDAPSVSQQNPTTSGDVAQLDRPMRKPLLCCATIKEASTRHVERL